MRYQEFLDARALCRGPYPSAPEHLSSLEEARAVYYKSPVCHTCRTRHEKEESCYLGPHMADHLWEWYLAEHNQVKPEWCGLVECNHLECKVALSNVFARV